MEISIDVHLRTPKLNYHGVFFSCRLKGRSYIYTLSHAEWPDDQPVRILEFSVLSGTMSLREAFSYFFEHVKLEKLPSHREENYEYSYGYWVYVFKKLQNLKATM